MRDKIKVKLVSVMKEIDKINKKTLVEQMLLTRELNILRVKEKLLLELLG